MRVQSISAKMQGDEREIIVVGDDYRTRYLAFGEVDDDGETYRCLHAPTQNDFDAVAKAMDQATAEYISHLVREGDAGL